MYNPYSLVGKTLLITGASSGIGRAIAIECSKMGASIVINGRNEERLMETFSELSGNSNLIISADISNQDGIQNLMSALPEVDGIVHCAGITKNVPFQFTSKESFEEIFNVNFYAPAEITRNILRSKKIKKNGSIVFISSISGVYCSSIASTLYSASKGAVNGLVKALALDLAPKGIRVNSVNPGVVETSIFDSGLITAEQLIEEKKRYPLKRFGQPKDVALGVVYLLSDASTWLTGTNLLIDGGFTLL